MTKQLKYYQEKLEYETDPSDLFQALTNMEAIVVLDARSTAAFEKEHIPGAINIPHREMTREKTRRLNKETLYVVYCDGIGCNASTKGALNMLNLGFSVKELMGGLDWWKKDGYETEGDELEGSGASPGKDPRCAC